MSETFPKQFSFCITWCNFAQTRCCWLADTREPQPPRVPGHLSGPVLRVGAGDSAQNRDCHDQVSGDSMPRMPRRSIPSHSRDEGRFACIASNKAGESRRSVQLVVKVSQTAVNVLSPLETEGLIGLSLLVPGSNYPGRD